MSARGTGRAALDAVTELRARKRDATILGYSEIPLLLARAAVEHALENDE